MKRHLSWRRFFRYTTRMLSGLMEEKFEVRITSSLGLSVPLDNTPTSLSVCFLQRGGCHVGYPDRISSGQGVGGSNG